MKKLEAFPKLSSGPAPKSWRRIGVLLLLFFIFAAGYVFGQAVSTSREQLDLTDFWRSYDLIEKRFVGSIDKNKAVEGAIKGLVESLGDPFSSYLPPQAKADLAQELKGEFEGIGAELEKKDNLITVVAPLDDSPAAKAGLKPKDVILKIGDSSTESMSLDDAVRAIRGPKGSVVKLTVVHENQSEPIQLSITRAAILVKSVEYEMRDNIAYVEIRQFGDDTVKLTKQALETLNKQNPKAFIIDLRNNPGGYLEGAVNITGMFIAPNVVVVERYKDGKIEELDSSQPPVVPSTPVYVLVNGGSASASEIVAGALQDYKRATIVGQKTFGKGSVQDILSMSGGSALRLTIAEWLTPKKREINKVGIEPDVKVDGDKTADADPVLTKALDLARQ